MVMFPKSFSYKIANLEVYLGLLWQWYEYKYIYCGCKQMVVRFESQWTYLIIFILLNDEKYIQIQKKSKNSTLL